MGEHTPGPWGWRDSTNGASLWGEHDMRPIVLDCGCVRDAEEHMMRGRDAEHDLMVRLDIESPDARLIAAAPALLAACEAAREAARKFREIAAACEAGSALAFNWGAIVEDFGELCHTLSLARAKARGSGA